MTDIKVLFATPCYGGKIDTPTFRSYMALPEALHAVGVPWNLLEMSNESDITRARNTIAKKFLDSDHTHLMFIDSDIEFTPDDFMQVLDANRCDEAPEGYGRPLSDEDR